MEIDTITNNNIIGVNIDKGSKFFAASCTPVIISSIRYTKKRIIKHKIFSCIFFTGCAKVFLHFCLNENHFGRLQNKKLNGARKNTVLRLNSSVPNVITGSLFSYAGTIYPSVLIWSYRYCFQNVYKIWTCICSSTGI